MSHNLVSMTPTGETRAQRRVRQEAERVTLARMVEKNPTMEDGEHFPFQMPPRWGSLTQMWGPPAPNLPHHVTTSVRFGVATPFLAESGIGHQGAVMGIDQESGGLFAVDPWELYRLRLITGTSMLCIGMVGSGKSTTAKTLATRLIALGRKIAVGSDPRAEWVPVANAVGGIAISLAPGGDTRINPLDPGVRPEGIDDDKWVRIVETRRHQLLLAVLSLLNHGKSFSAFAQTALIEALGQVANDPTIAVPTIPDVMNALINPTEEIRLLTDGAGRELGLLLRVLVHGQLAGMFDGASTIDPSALGKAPMIVFDTSALFGSAEMALSIATACTNAWLDSVLRAGSEDFWLIYNEEGWSSMRDPKMVELLDARQRLAGELGIANMLIMHELKDLDMVGPEGSSQRNQALGLMSKAQVKIIHKQAYESAAALAETLGLTAQEQAVVTNLDQQGQALWKIGKKSFLVSTTITDGEYDVFNTDKRREG